MQPALKLYQAGIEAALEANEKEHERFISIFDRKNNRKRELGMEQDKTYKGMDFDVYYENIRKLIKEKNI